MSCLVSPFFTGSTSTSWTLTIASGKTASDLTDYPVYVNLADMPAGFWTAGVASDGGNIRVKQSGSLIPMDLVKIDTTGHTGVLFFKAASLLTASSNVFTIDLTGSALLANGDTNGRNAVWSAYDWVCLLDDANLHDRTGGADGSTGAGSTSDSGFALGANCGRSFTSCRLDWSTRTSRTVFTLGVSELPDASNVSRNYAALSYRNNAAGSTNNRVTIAIQNTTTDKNGVWDDLNLWCYGSNHTSTAARRMHGVYNGTTNRKTYQNGALITTDSPISSHASLDEYTMGVGNTLTTEYWGGSLGFAYSRPEALSADFIAAEYSNLNAPSSFYAIA